MYPANSKTVRAAPPAIKPEPCLEGKILTLVLANLPITSCGTVPLITGAKIKAFLPALEAFSIAVGT